MRASHSRLSTWRRCRRKYLFSYDMGYRQPAGMGQLVGRVGHEALAMWYVNYRNPIMDPAVMEFAEERCQTLGVDDDGTQRLLSALPRYFTYAREHDDFEVLAIEQDFTVTLGDHELSGIIDLLVEFPDGRRGMLEHKFNQMVSMNHLGIDPQPTIYLIGAQEFGAEFVMYNVVRVSRGKKAEEDPVVREEVTRSEEYLRQFKFEAEAQFDELEAWHADPNRAQKSYANPMHSCSWDCGFFEECKAFCEGGDITQLSELANYNDPVKGQPDEI